MISAQCFRQRPITPPGISYPQIRLLILVHKCLANLVLFVGAHLFIWWCFWATHAAARLWSDKNTIYLPLFPCRFPSTFSVLCFQLLLSQSRKWETIACNFKLHYEQTAHTQIGQVHTSSLIQSCDSHVEIHHSSIWLWIFNLQCVCVYIYIYIHTCTHTGFWVFFFKLYIYSF